MRKNIRRGGSYLLPGNVSGLARMIEGGRDTGQNPRHRSLRSSVSFAATLTYTAWSARCMPPDEQIVLTCDGVIDLLGRFRAELW